jgi:hypothetical protein
MTLSRPPRHTPPTPGIRIKQTGVRRGLVPTRTTRPPPAALPSPAPAHSPPPRTLRPLPTHSRPVRFPPRSRRRWGGNANGTRLLRAEARLLATRHRLPFRTPPPATYGVGTGNPDGHRTPTPHARDQRCGHPQPRRPPNPHTPRPTPEAWPPATPTATELPHTPNPPPQLRRAAPSTAAALPTVITRELFGAAQIPTATRSARSSPVSCGDGVVGLAATAAGIPGTAICLARSGADVGASVRADRRDLRSLVRPHKACFGSVSDATASRRMPPAPGRRLIIRTKRLASWTIVRTGRSFCPNHGICGGSFRADFETLESYAHMRTSTLQGLGNPAAASPRETSNRVKRHKRRLIVRGSLTTTGRDRPEHDRAGVTEQADT